MSTETFIPLTFATFFQCGVKGFTNMHQRTCVNLLLKGILSINAKDCNDDVISDADCSNYAKGKRKISADIQFGLSKLNTEEIIKRLKATEIRDFATAVDTLSVLIKNSLLPEKEKAVLLKHYREGQELTFIAEVFRRSVKEDNSQRLTKTQVDILNKYKESYTLSADTNSMSVMTKQQGPEYGTEVVLSEKIGNEENIDWMGEYVPASALEKAIMPADSGVVMQCGEINLPKEYGRMIYILKPALREANVRKYPMNTFIEVLDIDAASNSLREGRLEYWQFEGAIDAVAALFSRIDFSDVCGFILQPIGDFEISQIENIERILKDASNVNVSMCSPLIYKDVRDFKLILLAHRSKRKADEQRLDTDHDHTQIYDKKMKTWGKRTN